MEREPAQCASQRDGQPASPSARQAQARLRLRPGQARARQQARQLLAKGHRILQLHGGTASINGHARSETLPLKPERGSKFDPYL